MTARIDRLRMWAEELRTTTLPQGTGCLQSPEGRYCCLGIAEIVAARETGREPSLREIETGDTIGAPSEETDEWFGISIWSLSLPFPLGVGKSQHLRPARANDNQCKTFVEIATAIDSWCDQEEAQQIAEQ